MANISNVRKYNKDICKALGVELRESDINSDYSLARFAGYQIDRLDSLGLLNRGFCPLCGEEPIANEYYRGVVSSTAIQYLCKNCYERTNPHFTPGYTQSVNTVKGISCLVSIAILIGIFLLIRGCLGFVF